MITLSSMQCGTRKENIETAVSSLDGIENIKLDKDGKAAQMDLDKSKIDPAKMKQRSQREVMMQMIRKHILKHMKIRMTAVNYPMIKKRIPKVTKSQ